MKDIALGVTPHLRGHVEPEIPQTPLMPEHPRPIIAIGAGGIVRDAHQPAYQKAGFPVYGIFDKNQEAARELADTFQIPRVFTSLADATEQAPAEAVYTSPFQPVHCQS